jgi:hypothetical protein
MKTTEKDKKTASDMGIDASGINHDSIILPVNDDGSPLYLTRATSITARFNRLYPNGLVWKPIQVGLMATSEFDRITSMGLEGDAKAEAMLEACPVVYSIEDFNINGLSDSAGAVTELIINRFNASSLALQADKIPFVPTDGLIKGIGITLVVPETCIIAENVKFKITYDRVHLTPEELITSGVCAC